MTIAVSVAFEFEPRMAMPPFVDLESSEGRLRPILAAAAVKYRHLLSETADQAHLDHYRCTCHGRVYATIDGGAELRLTPDGWELDVEEAPDAT